MVKHEPTRNPASKDVPARSPCRLILHLLLGFENQFLYSDSIGMELGGGGGGHQDDVSIWDLAAVTTSSVLLPALPATLGKSFNLFAPPLTQPFERGSVGHNNPDLLYMVVVKNYF